LTLASRRQVVGLRNVIMLASPADEAADRVTVDCQHHAVLRRADVDAAELVFGGDLALDELAILSWSRADPWRPR